MKGVRVFRGIYFNSDQFQVLRDRVRGKVKVFIDPDDLNTATVVLPGVNDPVEVQFQVTAFADMTLPEVLKLMAEHRQEDPSISEIYEDRILQTRRQRYDRIKAIGLEHHLPRSYSTVEECREMAKAVFAGARLTKSQPLAGTTRPGTITDMQPEDGVFRVGVDDTTTDAPFEADDASNDGCLGSGGSRGVALPEADPVSEPGRSNNPISGRESKKNSSASLPRPKNLKRLRP
jgi:hypothetical protein